MCIFFLFIYKLKECDLQTMETAMLQYRLKAYSHTPDWGRSQKFKNLNFLHL